MSNNQKSKQLTFFELIQKYSIQIPIIQRDYAQGRQGKEELRKNFLTALNEAVDGKSIELDFVYGSVNGKVFQPLDGQQRLTTLFLLYWYIAYKENKLDSDLKELLTKFSYETRTSSRDFCYDLINKGITAKNYTSISEQIIDSSWFFLSWKRDPTIKSMLTMLDAIQEQFEEKTAVWSNLKHITFHFIELQDFGLSDDLYIKMNARGKPLTDFENFKAIFEQHIEKKKWEKEIPDSKGQFSHKIDSIWTDLFWKHKGDKFFVIDYEITNFIAGMAIFNHALKGNEKKVQELNSAPLKMRATDFDDLNSFDNLSNALDVYAHKENKLDELEIDKVNVWDLTGSTSLFGNFIFDANKGTDKNYAGPSYPQRAFFYALTQFLIYNPNTDTSFWQWVRFSRNIIQNTTIDSAELFVRALHALNEALRFKQNILEHLKNGDCDKTPFFGTQISEEKIKAQLLLNTEGLDWNSAITELENHPILKGKIGVLLHTKEANQLETFTNRKRVLEQLFDENGVTVGQVTNVLGRALIAVGLELEGELWLGGCEKQYWAEHLKDPYYIPAIVKVLDELTRLNLPLLEGLELIITENRASYQDVVWKRNIIEHSDLFLEYTAYGKIAKNGMGIILYERQNYNQKTNAILIENDRNSIISELIKLKGFRITEGTPWLEDRFFSGEPIVLQNESKSLTFNKNEVIYEGEEVSYDDINNIETLLASL